MNFYDEHLYQPFWRAFEAEQALLDAIRVANPQPNQYVDAGPASLRLAAQFVMEAMTAHHQMFEKLRTAVELLEEHEARTVEQSEAA